MYYKSIYLFLVNNYIKLSCSCSSLRSNRWIRATKGASLCWICCLVHHLVWIANSILLLSRCPISFQRCTWESLLTMVRRLVAVICLLGEAWGVCCSVQYAILVGFCPLLTRSCLDHKSAPLIKIASSEKLFCRVTLVQPAYTCSSHAARTLCNQANKKRLSAHPNVTDRKKR